MMDLLCEICVKGIDGAIILSWENNPVFLSIINGIIGAIFGVVISSIVSYIISVKSLKAEKRYYIELEVITEKILNPLFKQYHIINKRVEDHNNELVSLTIFKEIERIFEENTCWYFVTNKKIKPILVAIRDYSCKKDCINLKQELDKLYSLIEEFFIKKYI